MPQTRVFGGAPSSTARSGRRLACGVELDVALYSITGEAVVVVRPRRAREACARSAPRGPARTAVRSMHGPFGPPEQQCGSAVAE